MKQKANQKIKSGYDRWKRNVLRRCQNIVSDGADVTCDGRLFQKLAPETGKARLPMAERLNSGTASWLEEADRSLCRDGTSVTRVKYDGMNNIIIIIIIIVVARIFAARCKGRAWDAPALRGWRLPRRTWNEWTSPWMKQLTWLRIIHSGDWCLRLMLCTNSGAFQKWMNEWMNEWCKGPYNTKKRNYTEWCKWISVKKKRILQDLSA